MIEELDADLFRRKLAGLADESDGEDSWLEEYREMASDFVLLMAIAFNRRQLDATTLWTRIDSGIQKGLAECDGDDVERLMSTCFEHVQASINVVATEKTALRIQDSLTNIPAERRAYFCQYLAKHRYAAIVLGRGKWQERKATLEKTIQTLASKEEDAK